MDRNATSSLPFLEAIRILPDGDEILKHIKYEVNNIECTSFLEIIKKNPMLFVKIQNFRHFRFLVIQYDKIKSWKLIYDGRHLKHLTETMPLVIWRFDNEGQLMENRCDQSALKSLGRKNFQRLPTARPLWQLLDLPENVPDPNGFEETLAFLTSRNLQKDVRVDFILAPGYGHKVYNWHQPVAAKKTVAVFTNRHYLLSFGMPLPTKKRGPKSTRSEEKNVPNHQTEFFSERQPNRSSAISVKLTALNLAFTLGLISDEQLLYASKELWKFNLAMWMEFDDAFKVRYVSICGEKMLLQTEIKDETSWIKVFERLEKEGDVLKKKKEKMFSALLQKLQSLSQNTNSLYSKCEMHLKAFINNLKIVVFSSDDAALHGIKIPFANYLSKKHGKKFRGLTLNGDSKHNLVLLKYTGIAIFNLNVFLKADVVPDDFPPSLNLNSCLKHLNDKRLCKNRGKIMAPRLLEKWAFVGTFFMQYFSFEIFTINSISLAKLAYESIWTKYTRMGGSFHHGLEKLKIAYEITLREHSHGGFSYSAQDELKVGDPIYKTHGEPAQTLIELDLISSYGYAGSHISVPKGFCTGYVHAGNGNLVCTEPFQRQQSFEYMAVFYTLWCCVQKNLDIKTVYSNFHQTGIFNVGNYPVDLVIVTKNGSILMYQFDGSYAHGCKQGCPTLLSYVGGKCKLELERKTSERDDFILNWAEKVNSVRTLFVQYFVKTDCHDLDYKKHSLQTAFCTIPMLNNLIRGTFSQKFITLNDVLNCSDELMYLMIAEGTMPNELCPQALLVLREKNWCRSTFTLPGKPILFTKDYADWLMQSFNFQFTKIHKVFFYKKCHLLNSIFKDLTILRMTPNLPSSTKQLIKMVINFTAGYFGLNQNGKTVSQHKIISHIGYRKINHATQRFDLIEGSRDLFVKTIYRPPSPQHKMSSTGISIFCSIVEFGKLRMSQILCLFQTCLSPLCYRHLYTNIDNFVIALSAPSLEAAVLPRHLNMFHKAKLDFFEPDTPGHLKEEFKIEASQNWTFVSAVIMNYVIIADNISVQKNSALNNMSYQQSYEASLDLLSKRKIVIDQVRRVHKIANRDVETITMTFNK